MDKVLYVGAQPPRLLLLGNSRIDNGFNPRPLGSALLNGEPNAAFNLGMPGINLIGLKGVVSRLKQEGVLGSGGVEFVILGLDESLFQAGDELGYTVIFGNPWDLLAQGDLNGAVGRIMHLWGFAPNLRGLREPSHLVRFLQASRSDVEPWGGSAVSSLGYRAAEENVFQDDRQLARQEASTRKAPDPMMVETLWKLLEQLKFSGVKVAVLYPPLLHRDVLFLIPDDPAAAPYLAIARDLQERMIPQISLDAPAQRKGSDFANAGHLNQPGSLRYTAMLVEQLREIWPELAL